MPMGKHLTSADVQRIAKRLEAGMSVAATARELWLAPRTVRKYRRILKEKTRTEEQRTEQSP